MDDFKRMAVFAAVVEQGSMSAAGRLLGLSTSAVSQQVRALEEQSGVTLLHRSTRKLSATDAGARFAEHCQAMVAAASSARQQLSLAHDAPSGELRMSAPVGFARHVAPGLAPLLAGHPALTLHLVVDDAMIDLIDARIDLAIRAGRLADSTWAARRLCEFDWVICASPEHLRRHGVPQRPVDLLGHQWLAGPRGTGGLQFTLTGPGGEPETLRVEPRITSNNQLTLQQMCLAGLGLAMVTLPDVFDDVRAGRLVQVLPEWQQPRIPVWAVTPQRENQPAKVRHAIAALADHVSTLAGVTR
ncbi:LysR family transcriptional regulator [Rhizobacter sp. Root1221]|nr:LysR family transcriptional regulator [Rhizobacter sp. Root1221]KQV90466.1 LysR family transcriptional regulator [Rhizobacter sp. Root1221]